MVVGADLAQVLVYRDPMRSQQRIDAVELSPIDAFGWPASAPTTPVLVVVMDPLSFPFETVQAVAPRTCLWVCVGHGVSEDDLTALDPVVAQLTGLDLVITSDMQFEHRNTRATVPFLNIGSSAIPSLVASNGRLSASIKHRYHGNTSGSTIHIPLTPFTLERGIESMLPRKSRLQRIWVSQADFPVSVLAHGQPTDV